MYPEPPVIPPENTNPPDWYDWCDEIYKIFKEERERKEYDFVRTDHADAGSNGQHHYR